MELSKYFKLEDFTYSFAAKQKGIENKPNEKETDNLKKLALILDRIKEHLNERIKIKSGYRSEELNSFLCGELNSFHTKGLACDYSYGEKNITVAEMYKLSEFLEDNIMFDMFIMYPDRNFMHISISENTEENKKEVFIKYKNTDYVKKES